MRHEEKEEDKYTWRVYRANGMRLRLPESWFVHIIPTLVILKKNNEWEITVGWLFWRVTFDYSNDLPF